MVAGGLRSRLIRDSVYYTLYDALEQLDWFTPGGYGQIVEFNPGAQNRQEPIVFNTLALSVADSAEQDMELGSSLVETTTVFYVDFYAENDSLGVHVINDVRDILGGRMPDIGRTTPTIDVMDWRMATPDRLFSVDVMRIRVDRAEDFPKPWLQYWYACRFEIVDDFDGR